MKRATKRTAKRRVQRALRASAASAASALLVVCHVLGPARAWGYADDLGPRALGMGEGGRADARATDALRLNPAGMSLAAVYTFAGDYQAITRDGGQTIRVAAADSTSDVKLAGGLYYGYRTASAAGAPGLAAHEAGLALAYPFVDRVFIGATAKYLHIAGGAEAGGGTLHSGFTVDVGLAIRPSPLVTFGVAGYNLRDLSTVQAPVGLGYGLAVTPSPEVALVLDVAHDFTTSDPTRGVRSTVGGGAEVLIKGFLVARAGGGRDGGREAAFVSGGLAAVSGIGALDASVRQDISGDRKLTFVVVGFRLFVESREPSSGGSSGGSSGDSSSPSQRRSEPSSDVK